MAKTEHHFKKKYGQNFLNEPNIIRKIADSILTEKNDLIIEIGPGSGNLTSELVKKSKVLAYEIDQELKPLLQQKISTDQLIIIWDDFLNRDLKQDLSKLSYSHLYVVANLPYYITTPILQKLIDSKLPIEKIVVMVQKEVGERFTISPGNKQYGSITVYLNYYFDIEKLFLVKKTNFMPKPNVDSVVISLTRKKDKIFVANEDRFFKLIRDSFQFKRKTLRNNLSEYNLSKIEEVLRQHDLDLSVRAEALSLEIFAAIANNLE